MDTNADPCENFYQFACGKFVEETISPDDAAEVSIFSMLNDKIKKQLRLIISNEIKEDDQPILKTMKAYFQTCMDTDQIEKNSENDLREVLKSLGGCPVLEGPSWNETDFDWKRSVYEANKMGYNTDAFVEMSFGPDPQDNTKLIIIVEQARTELPREYSKAAIGFVEILGADRKQAEKEVNEILDFQIELAKMSRPEEERRNKFELNDRMTLHQLEVNFNAVAWTEYIIEILSPYVHIDRSEEIIIKVPSFLESLSKLLAKTPKRVLANYLCIRTIRKSMAYIGKTLLSNQTADENVLGARNKPVRWETCLEHVSTHFSAALSRLYVRHYFDKSAKINAVYLTHNLRNSFNHLIEQANWMDNATKFAALEKSHSLVERIGYPNELENDDKVNELYKNLTLHPGSFLRSSMNLTRFLNKIAYSQLRKPVGALNWAGHNKVTEANAFYSPSGNSFGLPAGILQEHFYNNDIPNYMNYGAIGSLIDHELSHAFDNEGSRYDKSGNIVNWWKNETKEEYLKKVNCIIEQYGNYTVKQVNMTINGINTQGENIADNVGLKAAYFAYTEWAKNNSKEPRLPGLHYTPQQMFWISYANKWCRKYQPEELKDRIINNVHAPEEFRVIGPMSNLHEFSRDFKCPSGSPMNPVQKCSVW